MKEEVTANRNFGLLLGTAFTLLASYLFFKKDITSGLIIALSLFFLLSAIFFPQKLTPVKKAWEEIGSVLGEINTTILLTIVFYLVLTPIGLLMRIFRNDPLKLKQANIAKTYWEDRPPRKEQFEQQF